MSYQRAFQAINLNKTDMIPHCEVIENPAYIKYVTGIDPFEMPTEAYIQLYQKLDLDLAILPPPAKAIDFKGGEPVVDVEEEKEKVTEWGVTGSVWKEKKLDFKTIDDVFKFKPLEEGLAFFDYHIGKAIEDYHRSQKMIEDSTLLVAWNQFTLFQWPLQVFPFELFLLAAKDNPQEFGKLLADFAHLSIRNMETWAKEDIKVIMTHDDLAMTRGPMFSPDWYREYIFTWYPEIIKPLKQKGIKVIFCSDGNYDCLVDDIAATGMDGFYIEPYVDMEAISQKHPDKIIIGNVDTRVLIKGEKESIVKEVERNMQQAGNLPGYFMCVSNHIAQDVPVEAVNMYFEICRELGKR